MEFLLLSGDHIAELVGVTLEGELLGGFAEEEGGGLEVGELEEVA